MRWILLALAASSLFAQEFKVGGKVADFTVNDSIGRPSKFSALRGDLTVVMFVSVQCPISNDYNERMIALYNDYSAKGVKFVFLNANVTESPTQIIDHAKQVVSARIQEGLASSRITPSEAQSLYRRDREIEYAQRIEGDGQLRRGAR